MAQAAETRKTEKASGSTLGNVSAKASTGGSAKAGTKSGAKTSGKAGDAGVDQAELLKAYRTMLLIRRFEEKAGQFTACS